MPKKLISLKEVLKAFTRYMEAHGNAELYIICKKKNATETEDVMTCHAKDFDNLDDGILNLFFLRMTRNVSKKETTLYVQGDDDVI